MQLSETDVNGFRPSDNEEPFNLRLGQLMPTFEWSQFEERIKAAKKREGERSPRTEMSPIIIDFGSLTFSEEDVKTEPDSRNSTEKAIRAALAIGDEPESWSKNRRYPYHSISISRYFVIVVKARIRRGLTSSGHFVITSNIVGFWGRFITRSDIRYRIPISTIKSATPLQPKIRKCPWRGLRLEITGHTDMKFEFKSEELRDEAIRRIKLALKTDDLSLSSSEASSATLASFPSESEPRSPIEVISPISRTITAVASKRLPAALQIMRLPKAINLPRDLLHKTDSLHFVCLTIGSRGDVQPYIALGLGLQREGHRVTIVTHEEYKEWVVGFGIGHRSAGGDPGTLMKLSVENKVRVVY